MDGRKPYPQSWYWEKIFQIGLSNAIVVVFFLSGINLSISLALNLQYIRLATHQIFCVPYVRHRISLPPPPLPFYLLLQDFQNYFRLIWTTKGFSRNGNNISIDNHLKILPALLEVFLRHLSYCRRKAFNEAYDKINEFSNFKNNLFSRFNKPQDNDTELGSKDTFLRTWNSLLNYDQSLNIQFDWFFSLCNYSG